MALLEQVQNAMVNLRAVKEPLQLDGREHRLLGEVISEEVYQQLRRVVGVLVQNSQERV